MAANKKKAVARHQLTHYAVGQSGIAATRAASEAKNSASSDSNPAEYPQETVEQKAETVATRGTDLTGEAARQSYYRIRSYQNHVEKPPGKPPQETDILGFNAPTPHENTGAKRRARYRNIALQEAAKPLPEPAPQLAPEVLQKQPSSGAAPQAERIRKKRIAQLRKSFLKKQAVKQYFEKKAATKTGGTIAASTQNIAPKLPERNTKREIQSRIFHFLKQVGGKIVASLCRLVKAVANTLIALLGAGGVVLLLALVIGAAAAIIGSPMGILFADESGDPNAISIASIVSETNAEFAEAINDIVTAHPECEEVDIQYDYEDGHTWSSYWPEVLAVFAVNNNLNGDEDVVIIDEAKKQKIKDTFWLMHQTEYEVEQIEVSPAHADEFDPEIWHEAEYRTILHITVSSRTVEELAADFAFTQDQLDILHELLSDEMRPSLLALCGTGAAGGNGELQWPVPGYTSLSTRFGEPDAIRGLPHKGIDIPAPEGTPIYAAHSGTVLISGWSDSYGNNVMLDSGAGLSTRYAHMVSTAVSAGDTVEAGQIIGYVGSTGDSTGNHLHFELKVDGVTIDPLLYLNG